MTRQPLDFVARFNAVEVPAPIRTMDAIDERVAEAREAFFDRILTALELSHLAIVASLERDTRMLVPPDQSRRSEDYIDELRLKGVQPLASVLRIRDDVNYQVAFFNKYPLTPHAITTFREIEEIEKRLES